MDYPEIYLAIDNCFASKRWTSPRDWMAIIKDVGVNYVEASADNECDPLYADRQYLTDWVKEVLQSEKETGVKVASFYSGHGTYTTLGLTHDDVRNRSHIQKNWIEPMIAMATMFNAGLGFFCHAFPQKVLQNSREYYSRKDDLLDRLSHLACFASEDKLPFISIEQMYTPHQIPWTIKGAKQLISNVYRRSKKNLYITIDTGHQTGQKRFLRPELRQIENTLKQFKKSCSNNLWLGTETAYNIFSDIAEKGHISRYRVSDIMKEIERHPYLFAEKEDCDTYLWIERLGCFSPLIHLQQTDGTRSSHLPFDKENNCRGIIKGEKLLKALARAYKKKYHTMPPVCRRIYLTLEIFAGTSELPGEIIKKMEASVRYWRKFIPEDGLSLRELI